MALRSIVILCDYAFVNGGAPQVAIDSALGLRDLGLNVHLFSAVGPPDPRLAAAGVRVCCLGQRDLLGNPSRIGAALTGLWNPVAARQLAEVLRGLDPAGTVVHFHSWVHALSPSVLGVPRRMGFPSVLTLHDFFPVCPNGAFYDYGRAVSCPRRPMNVGCLLAHCDARSRVHKFWRILRQWLSRDLPGRRRGIADVIVLSERSRRVVEPYWGGRVRWHQVRNPVNLAAAPRAQPGASRDFLYVGRLGPEKGVELFLAAAMAAGVSARIVGDGELRGELERRFPGVAISGWRCRADVLAAIRSSRCLVFPSRWHETFGLSVHEARSQGVPVILSDTCAAAEVVRHGVDGLAFRNGDADSLADALRRYADDGEVDRAGAAAFDAHWSDPPSLQAHCRALRMVYQRLVSDAAPSGPESP